jgi:hypothetical protein
VTALVGCITDDVTGPRALELIDVAYAGSGQIADPLLRKCQKTIGKSLRKGAKLRQKARRKCAKPIALVEGAESVEVEDVAQVPDEHVRLERIASKVSIMAEYKSLGIIPAGVRIKRGSRYLKIT